MKVYIDENMPRQLAEGLAILEKPNAEGIEVYSIEKEFGRGVQDEDWIPQVGQVNGVVITQDSKMQRIRSQVELLRKYKIGIFYLIPPSKTGFTYWQMVEKIIIHWSEIKEIARRNKTPFAYKITARKIEKL